MTRRSFRLVRIAISAALYIALSLAIAPLTYGQMQIRFSEMMVLLCFFNKDYCLAMILGCAITNAFSPLGIIDVLFGTLGTAISVLFIRLCRKIWLTWIPPVICTVFVALELYLTASEPFWLSFATVGAGEFIAVAIIGVPVMMLLSKNKRFLEMIGPDDRYYSLMSKNNARTHNDEPIDMHSDNIEVDTSSHEHDTFTEDSIASNDNITTDVSIPATLDDNCELGSETYGSLDTSTLESDEHLNDADKSTTHNTEK